MWARVASTVLHPFLMPMYTLVTLFSVDEVLRSQPALFLYFAFILGVNTLGAAISLYLMFRNRLIDDLEIRDRRQRTRPFLIVLVYYLMTLYLLASERDVHTPMMYVGMIRGVVVSIAVGIVVTRRFKMSMHAMGVGGLVGAVFASGQIHFTPHFSALAGWILAAGFVGAARIALRAHTDREVYAGFLWGAFALYATILLSV